MAKEKNENIQENVEEVVKKKGFFARLWEGIRNVFSSIGNFFSNLFVRKPVEVTQSEFDEMLGEQRDQSEELPATEMEEKEVGVPVKEVVLRDFFIVTPEVEKYFNDLKNCHIVEKLQAIMKIEVTDENRDFVKRVVDAATFNLNGDGENWVNAIKLETDKHSQGMTYEDIVSFPEQIMEFINYAKVILERDVLLENVALNTIMNSYMDICKREFEEVIMYEYNSLELDYQILDEERLKYAIDKVWDGIAAGEISTDEAISGLLKATGIEDALREQEEKREEEQYVDTTTVTNTEGVGELGETDESEDVADTLFEEDESVVTKASGKTINEILESCPRFNDDVILNNVNIVNELIRAVDLEDMDEAEKTHVKNTFVEARGIIEKGDVALWNSDGAKSFEMKESDNLFNNDEKHDIITDGVDDPNRSK